MSGSTPSSVVDWYDREAARLAPLYASATPLGSREWLVDLLPSPPALVIDVGAGTGRDAHAFAASGHEVIAVEPSTAMRAQAAGAANGDRVRWLSDTLPALAVTSRLGLSADVVCLNAVWQHVQPTERARAFRKTVALLRSGGILVMTLRHGPDDGRGAFPTSLSEVTGLARDHGMQVLRILTTADGPGRPDVTWTNVVLRLPDDGMGAMPLLRHVILADAKSATYKLGLLRAICRAADGAAGFAVDGDDHVELPLGLIALIWLRLYMPLVAADLPQTPGNRRGAEGLGFAGPGWQSLVAQSISSLDLRVGAAFAGTAAMAVRGALAEAVDHIRRMPANYMTYPNGGQILQVVRSRAPRATSTFVLDRPSLAAFGFMRVPTHLWLALQRFACWVEPALVSEWSRLVQGYAMAQGRVVDAGVVAAAMIWSDPDRDVGVARSRALAMMQEGQHLHCVWSGRPLGTENLDVDHCLPWSAWPCGDLWNLMPSDRRVNQQGKRDRLPSAAALASGAEAIGDWWTRAYLEPGIGALASRFATEAQATLPSLRSAASHSTDEVLAAVEMQRLRLRQNQGVPEWEHRR